MNSFLLEVFMLFFLYLSNLLTVLNNKILMLFKMIIINFCFILCFMLPSKIMKNDQVLDNLVLFYLFCFGIKLLSLVDWYYSNTSLLVYKLVKNRLSQQTAYKLYCILLDWFIFPYKKLLIIILLLKFMYNKPQTY